MKNVHYSEVEEEKVEMDGVEGTTIRWLIKDKDGADNFAMRLFTMEKGGHTPYHQHDWEHEVFIVEGKGNLVHEGEETPFGPGHVIFVPSMDWHQFKNTGDTPVKFLCLVPYK